jgi:hypothetical protein
LGRSPFLLAAPTGQPAPCAPHSLLERSQQKFLKTARSTLRVERATVTIIALNEILSSFPAWIVSLDRGERSFSEADFSFTFSPEIQNLEGFFLSCELLLT